MSEQDKISVEASGEQLLYASLLNKGMIVGIVVLLLTYAVYVSGMLPTFIPVEDVPKTWHKSVAEYTHDYNAPTGWGWVSYAGKGDYLNFIGIAILAAISILCYAAILPGLLRKKDTVLVIIVTLEILVLCFAASGILKSGGH
jgi:hypothetical protein